jgi:hypothetical protein
MAWCYQWSTGSDKNAATKMQNVVGGIHDEDEEAKKR